MISEKKIEQIKAFMLELGIDEKDLSENFILGSSKGGQKLNKTHSCVQLTHTPTALQVQCQKERERETNRWLARRLLCEQYQKKILKQNTAKDDALAKKQKQKKRRQRKSRLKHEP